MSAKFIRLKNRKVTQARIDLGGHGYDPCPFAGGLITLEKGETEIQGCTFNNCKLMLVGLALRISKGLQNFIGSKPLKVMDFADPGIYGKRTFTTEDTERTEK
jgi:hypothetical protein